LEEVGLPAGLACAADPAAQVCTGGSGATVLFPG
jgi:hypothetical protein